MAKALTITVHPAPLSGEYLTVADAMRQVLDIVEALEQTETSQGGARQIVWRLTDAHTNSPPFTVVAEPYPTHPSLSVSLEANRLASSFVGEIRNLLHGDVPEGIDLDAGKLVRRALERNLNGIGKTEIQLADEPPVSIVPQSAKAALIALDRLQIEREAARVDWSRTEYGSVEGEVLGLTRWNGRPAVVIRERLSGETFTGVLSAELAEKVGAAHTWIEAWAERRVLVTGALHFNADSVLKRADLEDLQGLEWTDVPLIEARKVDLLEGRSVREHLDAVRGEDRG
jgi:hypothetical protein